jgi:exopolyphosphatase/guanosine-5'-triphosphate,3'-diphosphate pyrophosphatase
MRPVSETIIPRWEWRTFADDLGAAGERFDALTPERVTESDEVYLLSHDNDASVKLRDERADVKVLEEVDADGLERWRPVLKAAFPLSTDEIRAVMRRVGADADAYTFEREAYTLEQLAAELVRPSARLRTVRVHKRREHYLLGGCKAERTEIRTEHGTRMTIAVESEEPARVIAVVRDLGLADRRNVSLPRELKALTGFGTKRFAVIDVGTNSVKFHVAALRADGEWETVVDRAEVTRLGEGQERGGALHDEPVARTADAIAAMAAEAREDGVEAIAAVGTAGLRMAPNGAAVVETIRERSGVEVEVIDGEEEARLAYTATTAALGPRPGGSLVVFDTGGGSSQFTFGDGAHVDEQFSVTVGAARFTERFGLDGEVDDATLRAARDAIAGDLVHLDGRPVPDALIGMGGAVTNLAAVSHGLKTYDASVVQGTLLTAAEIDRQIELYRTHGADERRAIPGLQPNRAEVILAGACIVRTILAKLGCDEFTVSDRGLRHRLLVERFGP